MVKFEPRKDGVALVEFVLMALKVRSVEEPKTGAVDQFVEVDQLPELKPVHI